MQKALMVNGYWDSEGNWNDTTEELNELLSKGWKVANIAPMGAFGYGYTYGNGELYANTRDDKSDNGFVAMVIVEKD